MAKNHLKLAANHWPFALAFVLLMGGLALRVSESGLIHRLRNAGFDTMMRLSPREAISPSPIVLLAIDQTALDEQGQWPWSRLKMAELTDTIREAGAGVVVFDINFAQEDRMKAARVQEVLGIELPPGEYPDPDLAFAESLSQTAAVLASFSRQKSPSENGYQSTAANTSTRFPAGYFAVGEDPTFHVPQAPAFTDPLPSFARSSMALGSAMSAADADGILRRVPTAIAIGEPGALATELRFFLSIEALRVATGTAQYGITSRPPSPAGTPHELRGLEKLEMGKLSLPIDTQGHLRLYESHEFGAEVVSVADVLSPDDARSGPAKAKLAGKVVFVAPRVFGLGDRAIGPLGTLRRGVDFHVGLAEQIIAGEFVAEPRWARLAETLALLSLGLALMLTLAGRRRRLSQQVILGLALLALPLAASWLIFDQGWLQPDSGERGSTHLLVDGIWASLVGLLVFVSGLSGRALQTELAQRTLRASFSRYLPPSVVEVLDRDTDLSLFDPKEREITVMFVDVRGFTTLSEALNAKQSVALVNRFLTAISDSIQQESGTIDKYLGDGVMAFWNAPTEQPNHRELAIGAGLSILQAIDALNIELKTDPDLAEVMANRKLTVGIGLNTGRASVGNFGSEKRLDYSAIGDTVNSAARLEGLCKEFSAELILSSSTLCGISNSFEHLGPTPIRGREDTIDVYCLRRKSAHD